MLLLLLHDRIIVRLLLLLLHTLSLERCSEAVREREQTRPVRKWAANTGQALTYFLQPAQPQCFLASCFEAVESESESVLEIEIEVAFGSIRIWCEEDQKLNAKECDRLKA